MFAGQFGDREVRVTQSGLTARGRSACAGLALVAALGGCDPAGPDEEVVAWEIDVASVSDAGFGVRIFLNGEEVYSEVAAERMSHHVDVVRPYMTGDNLIEAEIIASTRSPAQYVASSTAEVSPTHQVVHADGVPSVLAVGERLFLRISL